MGEKQGQPVSTYSALGQLSLRAVTWMSVRLASELGWGGQYATAEEDMGSVNGFWWLSILQRFLCLVCGPLTSL